MKKTIWIINQFAGTSESGWGERHYYFSNYWKQWGYDIKIISGSYNHLFNNQPKISKATFTSEKIDENITFCWVKIPKYDPESVFKLWSMIIFAIKLLFLAVRFERKPDIILVSSMPIFSVLPAFILSKRFGSKFLFEVRDLWPQTPIHLKGYKKWHPIIFTMSLLEKLGFRKAEYIISLLPNSHDYINSISGNPSKWVYIPNGIDEQTIGKKSISNLLKLRIPKDKFVIGYTGTIGLANAMDYFIFASIELKDNENFHFVIVGDGYLKQKYMDLTKNNKNIDFIPKIQKAEVQDMLKLFDICYVGRFNSPLYKHGVSYNKYFDYMLAKKPILESSNMIKDPVELSDCGIIVEPENVEAIIHGINKLYKMKPEKRHEMGEKGYQYVKKYHDIEFLSKKYMSLFNS